MAQIISNIIQNSLSGMVAGAVTTAGNYAGDAVSGVGNMIEAKGHSIGNGLAKKFEDYGSGFTSYGNAVRNATAPNSGSSYPTTTKKKAITAPKKTGATPKKAPSSVAKKSLPSIPERKLLTAPPTKSVQEKGPSQGTYSKSVEPYKQSAGAKKSTYAASAAGTTVSNKTAKTQAGKMGNAKLNQAQKNLSPMKSATNAAGKVVISNKSRPGTARKAASAVGRTGSNEPYKGPLGLGDIAGSTDNNAKKPGQSQVGGYKGPLNLGGVMGDAPKANGQQKPPPSKPASVAGGAPKKAGYGGPLDLGGIA